MNKQELEAKIYDTYYDMGGDDARTCGLWKDVIDAKKSSNPIEELEDILGAVENNIIY